MTNVKLVATKDFSYSTRRLKAGEEFEVPEKMARVLVGIKKAEMPRVVGRVAVPPARVVEKVAEAAPVKVEEPKDEPKPVAAVSTRSTAADKPRRTTTTRKRPTTRRTAKKG